MIDQRVLGLAVERGIVTAEQAVALRALAAEREDAVTGADAEQLRFITGFADIFVTIGIALFLGGLVYLLAQTGPVVCGLAVAVASWLLSEVFARRMRMALPSIVLLLTFVGGAAFAALMAAGGSDQGTIWKYAQSVVTGSTAHLPVLLASGAAGAVAACLHYWRFAVPITIAAGCLSILAMLASALGIATPDVLTNSGRPLMLVAGLAVFALAMRFDRRDLGRVTRKSDIAFWLHMLSAPLSMHSIAGYFVRSVMLTSAAAIIIIGIVLIVGIVAVIIDRRALLVSGLIYLSIAFSSLLREASMNSIQMPLTILALGTYMLAISAFWRPLRRGVLALLPLRLQGFVPAAQAVTTG